jgi:hypothetical protein
MLTNISLWPKDGSKHGQKIRARSKTAKVCSEARCPFPPSSSKLHATFDAQIDPRKIHAISWFRSAEKINSKLCQRLVDVMCYAYWWAVTNS